MSDVFDSKRDEFAEALVSAIDATHDLLDEGKRLLAMGNAGAAEEFFVKAWDNTRFIVIQIVRRRIHARKTIPGSVQRMMRDLMKRVILFGAKKFPDRAPGAKRGPGRPPGAPRPESVSVSEKETIEISGSAPQEASA